MLSRKIKKGKKFSVKITQAVLQFVYNAKKQIADKLNVQATIFKNTKYPLTFKPVLVAQGVFVFAATLFLAITITAIIFPGPQIQTVNLINSQAITTKQLTAAIAGKPSQSIQWTALIKKTDITKDQHNLLLPKNAKNIKVKTISEQEAKQIASAPAPTAALAMADRKTLAFQPTPWLGALSYWFADLEEAVTQVVETIISEPAPEAPAETPAETPAEVTQTSEAVVVDLSAEAPTDKETNKEKKKQEKQEAKEEAKEAKEEKEEEKEEEKPDVPQTEPAAEELQGPSLQETLAPETQEIPAEQSEEAGPLSVPAAPAEETPAELESEAEAAAEAEESGEVRPPENLPSVSSAEVGLLEAEPAAEEEEEEYVAVTYETPAPTITEQETSTGKLVTVSDPSETNCEALNPANQANASPVSEALSNAGASFLDAVKNFFKSIYKFLTADLEQAVEQAVEAGIEAVTETPTDEVAQMSDVAPATSDITTAPETPAVVEEPEPEIAAEAVEELQGPSLQETPEQPAEQTEQPGEVRPPEPAAAGETAVSSSEEVGPQNTDVAAEAAASAAYEECLAQQAQNQLTNVLAFTTIPEIYKVGQEDRIQIKWKNPSTSSGQAIEGEQEMPFTAFDLNNNGKLDYVEWTVPHLSDQIFEIIFISKAWHLDENQNIIEDIYDTVATQDNNYATIPQNDYVRVTFEQILDSTKDITIHMRPNSQSIGNATIEVYPVYTDAGGNQTEGELVATFPAVAKEDTYKILLTNLQTPTDKFDLKVIRK